MNHTYKSLDQWSSPLLLLLPHFYLNDIGFTYANARADVDDACFDADALLDAFYVVAYATAIDANADAKMPNVARQLAGAYVVLLLPPLLPMLMLLRQLL